MKKLYMILNSKHLTHKEEYCIKIMIGYLYSVILYSFYVTIAPLTHITLYTFKYQTVSPDLCNNNNNKTLFIMPPLLISIHFKVPNTSKLYRTKIVHNTKHLLYINFCRRHPFPSGVAICSVVSRDLLHKAAQ